MKKNENSLTDPSIKSLFENKNLAFIATSMKDGSPHVTPTWVDIENSFILINTAMGRVKQKNVARDPRVSISVADNNNPYHMVTVNGEIIEQITGDQAEKHIDKLAKKYLNKEKYPGRSPGEKRILLKIKPNKVFHMNQ
ncbi:MAG TPA: PPOX class F420-dependent oxidoreductase [Nitrososphaeraceae archaeon]|jgi:PPOX class probable F420-dependent enzyme|nr:PPOX class F420-dependent oxidoreductase [Nitrososphaeraceae archaeon]